MRKWLIGAICATVVVAMPQSAGAFKDGHALLKAAESKNEIQSFGFVMYVAGVAVGARDVTHRWKLLRMLNKRELDLTPPFCVPPKITYRDLADTVRIWLRGHPELQGLPSALAIMYR